METMNTFSENYGLGLIGIELGVDTILYGHNGGIGNLTDMFHSPQLNLTVVVMQNSENGDAQAFNNLFLNAFGFILTSNIDENVELTTDFIYPNPVSSQLTIEIPHQSKIEISNIEGGLLKTFFVDGDVNVIDISDLSSGLYIIRVLTVNNLVTKIVVKQ
jgi:hypothetical protein